MIGIAVDRKSAGDGRQHADQRAHRDVDIAGDDHQRHADGGHGDIGIAGEEADEVGAAEEARVDQPDHHEQKHDRPPAAPAPGHRSEDVAQRRTGTGRAMPRIRAVMRRPPRPGRRRSSPRPRYPVWRPPRRSSATIRPPRMTSTRSLMPSTSGSSLEIIRMASPWPASSAHQRVDLRLGADVDAARRLVEDQDARARSPAIWPSTTFCWLPPESCRTICSGPRARIAEAADRIAAPAASPRRGRPGARRRDRGRARPARRSRAIGHAAGSAPARRGPPAHRRCPGSRACARRRDARPACRRAGSRPMSPGVMPKMVQGELGAARADQAGEAEDLAGAQVEARRRAARRRARRLRAARARRRPARSSAFGNSSSMARPTIIGDQRRPRRPRRSAGCRRWRRRAAP